MFDQGLTGITKDSFPAWIAMMFLILYPLWFVLGFETAKKYNLAPKFVPILIVGSCVASNPINYPIPTSQPLTTTKTTAIQHGLHSIR
jgi:hypothetical protein